VEKGHHATVASVKRSARGSNFVDPYTEEEVDARYRLMLKPGEVSEAFVRKENGRYCSMYVVKWYPTKARN